MHARHGMSLLELIIATALFAMVMVVSVQALTGIRRLVNSNVSQSDLATEARVVMNTITEDLANSAWLIDSGVDLSKLAINPDYDRDGARYYPYIIVQDYADATSGDDAALQIDLDGRTKTDGLDDFNRDPSLVATPAQILANKPGLPVEHLGASQEIIFLKVKKAASQDLPDFVETEWVDFNTPAAPMAAYSVPDAIPKLESLVLAEDTLQVNDMPLNWETGEGVTPWDGVAFITDDIRHYSYALVPGGRYGTQLVKLYRNRAGNPTTDWVGNPPAVDMPDRLGDPDTGMPIQSVVSELVDRIAFDTYRTSPDLGINQVRVRIWLSRPAEGSDDEVDTFYTESEIALRSTVDPEYSLRLTDWMGHAGDFTF